METQTPIIINDQHPVNRNQNPISTNLDFPFNSNNSHYSSSFLLPNGFVSQISDIEMITIQSVTYTSLKDLLPASPQSIISPTNNSSWNEIPIKNPLVKHAALAYLQPMWSPPELGGKGLFGKLKDWCCSRRRGECGCLEWFNGVVLGTVREVFGERSREEIDEEEEYDYDDDNKKVD